MSWQPQFFFPHFDIFIRGFHYYQTPVRQEGKTAKKKKNLHRKMMINENESRIKEEELKKQGMEGKSQFPVFV